MTTRQTNGNGRKLATQQSVNGGVKTVCDIMRRTNCAATLGKNGGRNGDVPSVMLGQ